MKLYFSIWGYRDYSRVGYDIVGVSCYTEKPRVYSGIGETEVYEVDIPDHYTKEQAKALGEKAVQLMNKTNDFSPRSAVYQILNPKRPYQKD